MRVLQRLTIPERLLALVFAPLLALALVVFQNLWDRWTLLERVQLGAAYLDLAQAASVLTHEFQRERGYSSAVIASRGRAEPRAQLNRQRTESDRAIVGFESVARAMRENDVNGRLLARVRAVEAVVTRRAAHRQAVDTLAVDLSANFEFYARAISELVGAVADLQVYLDGTRAGPEVSALRALMLAKETAGPERNAGFQLIEAGRLDMAAYRSFAESIGRQDSYLGDFRQHAPSAAIEAFDRMMAEPAVRAALATRAAILEMHRSGALQGITPAQWWDQITARLDGLQRVADMVTGEIRREVVRLGAEARQNFMMLLAMQVILIALVSLTGWVIGMSLARPLSLAARSLDRLAAGDLDADIPPRMPVRSEVGRISNVVGDFAQALRDRVRLNEERRAAEQREEERRRTTLLGMAAEVESATVQGLEAIAAGADDLRARADAMRSALNRAAEASRAAATQAETSNTINSDADSLAQQMTTTVAGIADEISRGSKAARSAVERAQRSRETIDTLSRSAAEIRSIVDTVAGIAQQTNLLALNATIEAARAGDSGRGFAVVAGEVKALADQTAKFTDQIGRRVDEIQQATTASVATIAEVAQSIDDLTRMINGIAEAIETQAGDARGVSDAVERARLAVAAVTRATDEIAGMISTIHVEAESVAEIADRIVESPRGLREDIPRIIREATEKSDRRRNPRLDGKGDVLVEVAGTRHQVRVIDVSLQGLKVIGVDGVQNGQRGAVLIPGGDVHSARVAWVAGNRAGIDLEGGEFSPFEMDILSALRVAA